MDVEFAKLPVIDSTLMSERLQGVALGVAMSSIAYCLYSYLSVPSAAAAAAAAASKNKSAACITTTADDDCHSLFYGSSPASNGSGFPSTRSVDSRAIQVMKTVHKVYTRLVRGNEWIDVYRRVFIA